MFYITYGGRFIYKSSKMTIRSTQLVNEIDEICDLDIKERYKIPIIKDVIKDWRERRE